MVILSSFIDFHIIPDKGFSPDGDCFRICSDGSDACLFRVALPNSFYGSPEFELVSIFEIPGDGIFAIGRDKTVTKWAFKGSSKRYDPLREAFCGKLKENQKILKTEGYKDMAGEIEYTVSPENKEFLLIKTSEKLYLYAGVGLDENIYDIGKVKVCKELFEYQYVCLFLNLILVEVFSVLAPNSSFIKPSITPSMHCLYDCVIFLISLFKRA